MSIPATMQAIVIENSGESFALAPQTVVTPTPAIGEVLVRVAYTALNRADLMQAQGKYPPPEGAPPYPGLEVSGIVAAVGEGVTGWEAGDKVCALLAGGGYAEYVCAPAAQCLPVPDHLSLKDAATLPEAFATTWLTIMDLGKLQKNETLLVHGGASGIGMAAIQLGKWHGARVFTTAGSDEKCSFAKNLGADDVLNYKTQDFAEHWKDSVDVVLDMTGGDNVGKNFSALKKGGRLISIAFIRGVKTEIFLAPLLTKHISWIGSTLRSRTAQEKADLCKNLQENLWPAIAAGSIKPVIDSEFPLGDAQKAIERMRESLNSGKIVLQVNHSLDT